MSTAAADSDYRVLNVCADKHYVPQGKTSPLSNVTVSALRTAITRTTKRPFSFHTVGFQLLSPIIKSCAFTK